MARNGNDFSCFDHYSQFNLTNANIQKLHSQISGDFCSSFTDSRAHLELGKCYYKNSDLRKAIKHFNLAVDRDSDNFVALYWLALIEFKKLKNFKDAVHTFREVLRYRFKDKETRYFYTNEPDLIFQKAINFIVYITFNKLLLD